MKAYTDIEQSKKLAEILPLESADMSYRHFVPEFTPEGYGISLDTVEYDDDIPCWSLAALLNGLGKIKEHWFYHLIFDFTLNKYSVEVEADSWRYEGDLYDNAIDAVYETILKLHEQKSK